YGEGYCIPFSSALDTTQVVTKYSSYSASTDDQYQYLQCDSGYVMTALSLHASNTWLDNIDYIQCTKVTSGNLGTSRWGAQGASTDDSDQAVYCPIGQVASGF